MRYVIRQIAVPFRFQYGHKLKTHRGVDAIICQVMDAEGRVGLGEAVPREYVTGETCESVMASIQSLAEMTRGEDTSAEPLIRHRTEWAQSWTEPFPSCALCALDLARSDLFAQQQSVAVADWLGGGPGDNESSAKFAHNYCASIGFGDGWKGRLKLGSLAFLYQQLGFKKFKIKVGNDDDESRVRFLRRQLGNDAEIFADANTAWNRESAARNIEMLTKYRVWAIEEPLKLGAPAPKGQGDSNHAHSMRVSINRLSAINDEHLANLQWLKARIAIPIIADESLICLTSLQRLLDANAVDLLNIRLSKCGGPLLAMRMVELARQHRLEFAIAAMVGETPILATAGAHFAAHCEHWQNDSNGAPRYVQGFSHRLLHRIKFVVGEAKIKRATVTLRDANGLGLTLDPQRLDSITKARLEFDL